MMMSCGLAMSCHLLCHLSNSRVSVVVLMMVVMIMVVVVVVMVVVVT